MTNENKTQNIEKIREQIARIFDNENATHVENAVMYGMAVALHAVGELETETLLDVHKKWFFQ